MVMPGVEHTSYAPELSLSASFTTASQSTNKSNASNETGCLVEEHSRCLQMVTFGVEQISCGPELSRWALHTAASQSTTTGMSLTIRNYSLANVAMFSRSPELKLELIQTQMTQKPMLRAEVGMRVRCANKASAE